MDYNGKCKSFKTVSKLRTLIRDYTIYMKHIFVSTLLDRQSVIDNIIFHISLPHIAVPDFYVHSN